MDLQPKYMTNGNRGVLILYVREGITSDLLSTDNSFLLRFYSILIFLSDLNIEPNELPSHQVYSCLNIVRDKTCFKNPHKPSCVDVVIENRSKCFQGSIVLETGLSDFYLITLAVMNVFYKNKAKYNLI